MNPAETETVITASDCTAEKLGAAIPASAIGEPVSAVTLSAPVWTADSTAAQCVVDGSMAPVDKSPNARAISPLSIAAAGS